MRKAGLLPGILLLICGLGVVGVSMAITNPDIKRSVLSGGGEPMSDSGSQYLLRSTLGEPIASQLTQETSYGLSSGYWWPGGIGGGSSTVYLPSVLHNVTNCYASSRETEDNDQSAAANGPLCPGQTVLGFPDDTWDIFTYQHPNSGQMTVSLSNHTGVGVQLSLYAGIPSAGTLIQTDSSPPYQIVYNGTARLYYISIYTVSGFNSNTSYALSVTTP